MIVPAWYGLQQAIERAVPCYTPRTLPGHEERCLECEGCINWGIVTGHLEDVEGQVETALNDAYDEGFDAHEHLVDLG